MSATELSAANLKQMSILADCMDLSLDQLRTLLKLMEKSEPWEKTLVSKLMEERVESVNRIQRLEAMLSIYRELPTGAFEDELEQITALPEMFSIEEQFGFFNLAHHVGELKSLCGVFNTRDDAIAQAVKMDKELRPGAWRPYSQTCPANEMLLFACADGTWTSSTPPVKTGYREGNAYKVFGASWKPTHWTYQPDSTCLLKK